jgi:hypothetical protein
VIIQLFNSTRSPLDVVRYCKTCAKNSRSGPPSEHWSSRRCKDTIMAGIVIPGISIQDSLSWTPQYTDLQGVPSASLSCWWLVSSFNNRRFSARSSAACASSFLVRNSWMFSNVETCIHLYRSAIQFQVYCTILERIGSKCQSVGSNRQSELFFDSW